MTETILSDAQIAYDKAEADLREVESYLADAKAALKPAATRLKDVEKAVNAYAPRVVNGVMWLNENARGWTNIVNSHAAGPTLPIPDEKQWASLGFEPDPKVDKRINVDSEDVLDALWQAALTVHLGKKKVTVERVIRAL